MDAEVKALYEGKIAALEAEVAKLKESVTAGATALQAKESELSTVSVERDKLQVENDNFKTAAALTAARTQAEEAIKAAGLDLTDKVACSPLWVESVVKADAEGRKQLIADRLAIVGKAAKPAQWGSQGRKETTNVFDAKAAAEALFN